MLDSTEAVRASLQLVLANHSIALGDGDCAPTVADDARQATRPSGWSPGFLRLVAGPEAWSKSVQALTATAVAQNQSLVASRTA